MTLKTKSALARLRWILIFVSMLSVLAPLPSMSVAAESDLGRYGDMSGREVLDAVINRQPDFNNEYMHRWFRQAFGGFVFGGQNLADEVGLLSYVLGFTNILALLLGIIIVFYTFIAGAVNTASSGEVLGKNWSTVWLPARTAAGFALIMPVPGIGGGVFSAAQMIIISILIMGSNSASFLWSYTAEKVTSGVYPVVPVGLNLPLSAPRDLYSSLICAAGNVRNQQAARRPAANSDRVALAVFDNSQSVPIRAVDTNGRVTWGNGAFSGLARSEAKLLTLWFGPNGSCGKIDIPWSGARLDTNDTLDWSSPGDFGDSALGSGNASRAGESNSSLVGTANGYKERAALNATLEGQRLVLEFLDKMSGDAQTLITMMDELPDALADESNADQEILAQYKQMQTRFISEAQSLRTSFAGKINTAASNGNRNFKEEFKADMTKGGWAGAGRWALELSTFQSISYRVVTAFAGAIQPGQPTSCSGDCSDGLKKLRTLIDVPTQMIAHAAADDRQSVGMSGIDKLEGICTTGQACSSVPPTATTFSAEVGKAILNTLAASDANSSTPVTDTSGLVDPFQTMSTIGHRINNTAGLTIVLSRGIARIVNFMRGNLEGTNIVKWAGDVLSGGMVSAVAYAAMGALQDLVAILTMMAYSLFSIGFALAYLIPFLPILTWVTQITGYIVTVITAVVAAPLSVILMVTPEGEGIAGTRLERAMNLLATATLQPTLMIVGVVASIVVANIGFAVFNLLFWDTLGLLMTFSFFNLFAVLVIYTMGAYQLTQVAVSIMYSLKQDILEWFSSGSGKPFGEQDIKGALQQSMGAISGQAQGMGTALQNVGKGESSAARDRRKEKDKDKT